MAETELSDEKLTSHSFKDLHPSEIAWLDIKDEESKKNAQAIIDKWVEEVQKDVSHLLRKHHITKYQLSFLHEGSKTPMLLTQGTLYEVTKLSVVAARQLRNRVAEDLSID